MTKFIKFSNRIVNTAFIRYVDIDKPAEKFTIHLDQSLYSNSFFGSSSIKICASKAEHPESYATVEKWIQSIHCVSDRN
jgi:hypothetical protein